MSWYPGKLIVRALDRTRTQADPATVQEITRELENINSILLEVAQSVRKVLIPFLTAYRKNEEFTERLSPQIRERFDFIRLLRSQLAWVYDGFSHIVYGIDTLTYYYDYDLPTEYWTPKLREQVRQLKEIAKEMTRYL